MKRRSFIGIALAGIASAVGAAPRTISRRAQIAAWRKRYGAKPWDAAQGGFIAIVTMIDCRDPKNPVQFRSAVICEKGMAAVDAEARMTQLGQSAGRKIGYLTGRYDAWPEENGAKV